MNVLTDFLNFFGTMTNKCKIITQIITLLHVSTLSWHPQGDCNQYLAKLNLRNAEMQLSVIQLTINMFHTGFMQVLTSQSLKYQYYKIFKTLKLSYLQ
jgi:hypothetical protein